MVVSGFVCPRCGSSNLVRFEEFVSGQFKCLDCGWVGFPLSDFK